MDSGLVRDLSGRGAARAEDAQGTPTQSRISLSKLVYEDYRHPRPDSGRGLAECAEVPQERTRFILTG